MEENWKDIEGYEGIYKISDQGRVKRILPEGKENYLKGSITILGYNKITLSKDGECKDFFLHRLVLNAFLPNTNRSMVINHKDGNKLNNRLENLEWITQKDNIVHAWENGLMHNNYFKTHRKGVICKETNKQYKSIKEAREDVGLKSSCGIRLCLEGKQETAGGYHWAYSEIGGKMRKELNNIVKDLFIYILKEEGFVFRKKHCQTTEWYKGFWSDNDNMCENVGKISKCCKELCLIAKRECLTKHINVRGFGCDITYHSDRHEYYYNIFLDFGGY